MIRLSIRLYDRDMKENRYYFVLHHSINGTFLQTRNFLDYHGNRFRDTSLLVIKNEHTVIAVVPACTCQIEEKKVFSAHMGSTFGGIVIAKEFNDIEHVQGLMDCLEKWFVDNQYNEVWLKCTSEIFAVGNVNLLYYFLFQRGYHSYDEISSYIDFNNYQEDILSNFSYGRRRDYKYSLKNKLEFRMIDTEKEISSFYEILCKNLKKFDAVPVHSLAELLEFKESRLTDIVEFYGVFWEKRMIAGSMVFNFSNRVFHTQYLAADPEYLKMFPMNFLDTNLIMTAKNRGIRYFSFGTSTEEKGKILNKHLAQFKEGFGTEFGINKNFCKVF